MNQSMTRINSLPKLRFSIVALSAIVLPLPLSVSIYAQKLTREQWGGMAVTVSHANGKWVIAGKKNKVTLNEANLAIDVQAGSARWAMVPSAGNDMLVKSEGEEFPLRLTEARKLSV